MIIVLNVHSNESAKSESVVYFSWQSPLCFDILVSMGVGLVLSIANIRMGGCFLNLLKDCFENRRGDISF